MFNFCKQSEKPVTFLSKLNRLLTRRDRIILFVLLGFSIIVSFVETLGLTAVMLFISVTTNFDAVYKNSFCKKCYLWCHCKSPADFIIILGVVLAIFYIFRGALNIFHSWLLIRFAQGRYKQWAQQLFAHYLNFFYKDLVMKNSSTISQALFGSMGHLCQVINALLTIAAECFTILCLYGMLAWVNWKMTCVLTILLLLKSYALIRAFSQKLAYAGVQSRKFSIETSRTFSESFYNYKLIKLLDNTKIIINRFTVATQGVARSNILNTVLQNAPRFILETLGFLLLVSIILYIVYFYGTATSILPVVALYALAFYRLLPSVNKILSGYNQIIFCKHGIHDVYDFGLHRIEVLGSESITFNRNIAVRNVSFGYKEHHPIIQNVNIEINKGERIAFIGESGAGKSTIVDVLMGLYEPQEGQILIDGIPLTLANVKAWRGKIGYIPQSIYLFDGSIADNVVFGRTYDATHIISCLKKANIYDFLMTQEGIHTIVGEGGIRLSGGQKQRVAIARALYSDPEVLVLDEATSALDTETEGKIMDEIYSANKDKTLIIVAHRLTTVARCEKIYKIEKGLVSLVDNAILLPESQLPFETAQSASSGRTDLGKLDFN